MSEKGTKSMGRIMPRFNVNGESDGKKNTL
jgi:hypothetical protein